ncbi:MAG: hypothetical protein EPO42_14585, partial [Gallionellaceae bacterium]
MPLRQTSQPLQAAERSSRPVPAVARAAGMLLLLGNGQEEASLTDLARLLGIHKST